MKTTTINLFIASSSTSDILNEQKEALVKLCRKLNTDFATDNIDFEIKPIAYEDLERRMDVFESHIKNDDIVVFLIDETLGPFLEEKLKKATDSAHSKGKPELLVFVSKNLDHDSNQRINEILKKDGWLYELLDDTDELLTNVEKRIKGYAAQYQSKQQEFKHKIKNFILYIVLPIVLLALGYIIYQRNDINRLNEQVEAKRLLIFGGGSARNYIERMYLNGTKLVQLNPELWWYAPMPSGDAYRMIAEEIINFEEDYKDRPYYPIIISAVQAKKDSAFRNTYNVDDFKEKGIVIGIHLDNDTLIAYGSSSIFNNSSSINQVVLDSLILNPEISVWKTSDNSGTFNTYKELCPNLKKKELNFFSENSIITNEKWIALGSASYHPANDKNNIDYAIVTNEKNNHTDIKYKSIYVYFLLYNDKNSSRYMLPKAIEEFLRAIQVDTSTIRKIKNIECINKDIREDKTTVLYENFERK